MAKRIILEIRASQVSQNEHRRGLEGDDRVHTFNSTKYFNAKEHTVLGVNYSSDTKRVTITFTSGTLTKEYKRVVGTRYVDDVKCTYDNASTHSVTFTVPCDDDYRQIKSWIFREGKFTNIARRYPGKYEDQDVDEIYLNYVKLDVGIACSHKWDVASNEPFFIDIE